MKASYSELCDTIREAVTDAILQEPSLDSILQLNEAGNYPYTGISLDMAPWHSWLGISLRTHEEAYGELRYQPSEWRLFDLINSENSPSRPFRKLANHVAYLYSEGDPGDHLDRAHMLFLAGAEALISPEVQAALQERRIPAQLIEDSLVKPTFEYVVFDPDETLRANYCELVLALRLRDRLTKNGTHA